MPSIINATTTTGVAITGDNSGNLAIQTNNGNTAVTIDTSQNVGIGTASPSYKLQITNSTGIDTETGVTNSAGLSRYGTRGSGNAFAGSFTAGRSFELWSAGSQAAIIDPSGRLTMPSQTGFKVNKLSNAQSITANTWTRISFNNTASTGCFNTGSGYSTSTNLFTAPITGKYLFTASVNISAGAAGQMYVDFGLNGSNNVGMEATLAYPAGDTSLTISTVISMAANDTMEVDLFTTNATTAGNRICGFSGQLLS